jgi:hypothetical protein
MDLELLEGIKAGVLEEAFWGWQGGMTLSAEARGVAWGAERRSRVRGEEVVFGEE